MATPEDSTSHHPLNARPATLADAPFLGRIDDLATKGEGEGDFLGPLLSGLDTDYETLAVAMFQERAINWGEIEDFIVLESEGKPVAACSVFEPARMDPDPRPYRLRLLPRVARRLDWTPAQADLFVKNLNAFWPRAYDDLLIPQADGIIEIVGVIPEARGRGLGSRLLKEAFAVGRQRGYTTIGIMASLNNTPARRLYERVGFEPYLTFHSRYFSGAFPGIIKYKRSLETSAAET
ncbi:MAG: GNAT family N-acetyltransferase [Verrucomicrobiota bacterium]